MRPFPSGTLSAQHEVFRPENGNIFVNIRPSNVRICNLFFTEIHLTYSQAGQEAQPTICSVDSQDVCAKLLRVCIRFLSH